jgi:hypothetical protein
LSDAIRDRRVGLPHHDHLAVGLYFQRIGLSSVAKRNERDPRAAEVFIERPVAVQTSHEHVAGNLSRETYSDVVGARDEHFAVALAPSSADPIVAAG